VVFDLANSWPLDIDPSYVRIQDDWVDAGHEIQAAPFLEIRPSAV